MGIHPRLILAEAMSPGGLVPEITNGRGAMAAMLIAFVKELTTGKPVGEQIKSDPIFIVIVFGLIIVGSIVPVFRGADLDQKGAGPFTPRAEIWNGRVVCSMYLFACREQHHVCAYTTSFSFQAQLAVWQTLFAASSITRPRASRKLAHCHCSYMLLALSLHVWGGLLFQPGCD